MKLSYKSYTEFALKADILTRELTLTAEEAAELLAKISGYESHSTMQIGQPVDGLSLSRNELVRRFLSMRTDICEWRANQIIDQMKLPNGDGNSLE